MVDLFDVFFQLFNQLLQLSSNLWLWLNTDYNFLGQTFKPIEQFGALVLIFLGVFLIKRFIF